MALILKLFIESEWACHLKQMLCISSDIVQSVLTEIKKKRIKTLILNQKSNQTNFRRKLWLVYVGYGVCNEKNTDKFELIHFVNWLISAFFKFCHLFLKTTE